jgi:hypothetical protein
VKAEGYAKRRQPLGDWTIEIETYQLGDVFYCTINNVDPGARFARAEGSTRDEAEGRALEKAEKYIKQTRRFPTA